MPRELIALLPDRCTLPAIDQDVAPEPNSFRYFEC
jgi:hypothetical protein